MNKPIQTLAKSHVKVTKTVDITPLDIRDFFSFKREPGNRQVLCVTMWYVDGSTDELIVTSPHVMLSEDVERQCRYIQMYLRESFEDLGIVAYQSCISKISKGELGKPTLIGPKVDCSTLKRQESNQFRKP